MTDCPCCGAPRPAVTFNGLSVSLDAGALWEGEVLKLSGQQLYVLHHLTKHAPGLVHRDRLMIAAMPDDASIGQLGVVIHRLRKTLAAAGVPVKIICRWGAGYAVKLPNSERVWVRG